MPQSKDWGIFFWWSKLYSFTKGTSIIKCHKIKTIIIFCKLPLLNYPTKKHPPMKKLLLWLSFFSLSFPLSAQNLNDSSQKYTLLGYVNNSLKGLRIVQNKEQLVGLIDSMGKEIIKPRFRHISQFQNGTAIMSIIKENSEENNGIISEIGEILLEPEYKMSDDFGFNKDLIFISKAGKYGIFSKSEKKLKLLVEYSDIQKIQSIASERFYIVTKDDLMGFYSAKMKEILPVEFQEIKTGEYASDLMVKKKGKVGMMDLLGNLQIPFRYEKLKLVNDYSNPKIIYATLKGKTGIIDDRENVIIPLEFDDLNQISYGVNYKAKKKGRVGLVDKSGEWIIQPQFDDIALTKDGEFSASQKGKWGYFLSNDKQIVDFKYDEPIIILGSDLLVKIDKKQGIADRTGKEIIAPQYDQIRAFDASNRSIVVIDNKLGLIDREDNIIIPPTYDYIGLGGEPGYYMIGYLNPVNQFGFINSKGEKVLPIEYTYDDVKEGIKLEKKNDGTLSYNLKKSISSSSTVYQPEYEVVTTGNNGLKIVKNYSRAYGVVNEDGQIIVPIKYIGLSFMDWGRSSKISKIQYQDGKGKWGVMSIKGEVIVGAKYDSPLNSYNGYNEYIGSVNYKYGILSNEFKQVVDFKYDRINFSMSKGGTRAGQDPDYGFEVIQNTKRGYINRQYKEVIKPEYQEIQNRESFYVVKKNDKYGFINLEGKIVAEPLYEEGDFWGDFVILSKNQKKGVLKSDGSEIIPFIYDEIKFTYQTNNQIPWTFYVTLIDKKGIINNKNKTVIPVEYDVIEHQNYSEEYHVQNKGLKGIISINEAVNVPPLYNSLQVIYLGGQLCYKVEKNHKYGIVGAKNGEIIASVYDDMGQAFTEGLLNVKQNDKWGFINEKGDIILPMNYSSVSHFENGLSIVKIGEKKGAIDKTGKVIIQPKYDEISIKSGNYFVTRLDGKYGAVERSGTVVVEPKYDLIDAFGSDGHTRVKLDGKWGLIDQKGAEMIAPKYQELTYNEYQQVTRVSINGKWGVIENTCREPIAPKYDGVGEFNNNYAVVSIGSKYGAINKLNKEVIPVIYDQLGGIGEGRRAMMRVGDKWGFVNTEGVEVIPLKYNEVKPFREGKAIVKIKSLWGVIDTEGNYVAEPKYEQIADFTDNFARVSNDGKFGAIDKTGLEFIPTQYDEVIGFSPQQIQVRKGGKCGMMDLSGNLAIPIMYDYFALPNRGTVAAGISQKWGILDRTGKILLPLEYTNLNYIDKEAAIAVQKDEKWQALNLIDMKPLSDSKYDALNPFSEGIAGFKKGELWGFMDYTGKEIIAPIYQSIQGFYGGKCTVTLKGESIVINKQGITITDKK